MPDLTGTLATRSVSRRTVVKGAAWSVPAIAVAVAVPSASASPVALNVSIRRENCSTVGIGTPPYFSIFAEGADIPAGTTFELALGAGLDVGVNLDFSGLAVDFSIFGSGNTRTLVLKNPISKDNSLPVKFLKNFVEVGINRNATLSLLSLPAGYTDSDSSDDSRRMSWTGITVVFISLFSCSG